MYTNIVRVLTIILMVFVLCLVAFRVMERVVVHEPSGVTNAEIFDGEFDDLDEVAYRNFLCPLRGELYQRRLINTWQYAKLVIRCKYLGA